MTQGTPPLREVHASGKSPICGAVWWQWIAVWFAVAIIAHDLIVFPLYALADRLLPRARRNTHSDNSFGGRTAATAVFPGIIEQGGATFTAATGLTQTPYLTRWLLLTAAFYLISALCYATKTAMRQRHDSE